MRAEERFLSSVVNNFPWLMSLNHPASTGQPPSVWTSKSGQTERYELLKVRSVDMELGRITSGLTGKIGVTMGVSSEDVRLKGSIA